MMNVVDWVANDSSTLTKNRLLWALSGNSPCKISIEPYRYMVDTKQVVIGVHIHFYDDTPNIRWSDSCSTRWIIESFHFDDDAKHDILRVLQMMEL